ncbi:MAG: MaoC family dehydratase N-terminal domain-containing protein [Acidimicrobiales bacterium]
MVAMGGQLRSHSTLAGRPARGLRATVRSGHPSAHPVVDAVPTQPATSPTTEEEPQVADDILNTIIGKPTGTTVVTVERGQLALFASAVKDESPIYRDPRAAAQAGLPGIPAPPTYPFVMGNFGAYPELQPGDAPSGNPMAEVIGPLMAKGGLILHGEQEFTYHRPVFVGDVLVGEGKVVDAYRKESKGRTMTFVVVETAWSERSTGEPVCTSRMNIIHRI